MIMRRRLKEDDRGIALISVMICVMLSFLLSATIMRVSLLSYLQKGVAKQSTSTFYENETFVDDIKLGVQQKVATAFASSTSTSQIEFLKNFKKELLGSGAGSEKEKLEAALAGFIMNSNPDKVVTVKVDGESGEYFKAEGEGEIVIKNVRIEYIDNSMDGYVSNIKTDIRIRSPFYIESSSSDGGYSMFAGGGFTIPANGAKPATLDIRGNIYIGYDNSDNSSKSYSMINGTNTLTNAKAMEWTKHCAVYWMDGSTVTINGDIYVSGYSNLIILSDSVDVRGKIYVSKTSHVIVSTGTELKCQDIVVDCSETSSGGGWKISSTSGRSIRGNFSYGTAETVTYLPTSGESTNVETTWGTRTNQKAGLYYWDGTNAKHVTSSSGTTVPNLPKLTFDASNYPHPRIKYTYKGTDYWFDEQYLNIVDVEYFLPYALSSSGWPPKNPEKILGTADYTVSGDKWLPKSGVSLNGLSGGGGEWQNYTYGSGLTHQVMVNFGKQIQTVNSNWHFVMAFNATINMNDMNTTQGAIGVYICPEMIECTAREGNSHVGSLADQATDISYAKAFFDNLGRQVLSVSSVDLKYLTVNNFFKGGIKIFYESSSGGGGTTVVNDEVKNKSLDIVSFENWEKY